MSTRRWSGKDFVDMMTILSMDLMETYDRLSTDWWHQPARRTWVRTFFSQVEAFAYSTKQMLANFEGLPFVTLTPDDLAFLREETDEVREPHGGKLRRRKFLPMKDNLKHLSKVSARAMGFGDRLDASSAGWAAFLSAIKIRDRLVHPKSPEDLIVSDDEMRIVSVAQDWYHVFQSSLWTCIDRSLKGLPEE